MITVIIIIIIIKTSCDRCGRAPCSDDVSIFFSVNKHHTAAAAAAVEIKHEHFDAAAEHFLFPGPPGGHHHHPQLGAFGFPLTQAPVPAHHGSYQHALLNGHVNNKLMAS